MKTKTRIFTIILTLLFVCTLFSGCGQEKVADGFTEVVWWDSNGHAKQVTEKLVEDFNNGIGKENKVRIVYKFDENSGKNVDVAFSAGGELPDFITGNLVERADKGQIAAIEDLPGGKEFLERYDESLFREGTNMYNGKVYTVPQSSQLYGLIYNKDLFKAAGIVDEHGEAKAPETWDEVIECAKKLTDKSKKQFGIIFPMKWTGWYGMEVTVQQMSSTGMFNGYDTKNGTYDFSSFKPVLDALITIRDDGSYYPGAENIENDAARARFAEGNIGMKFGVTWDVGVLNDQFPAKFDWGVAPLPSLEKDKLYYQRGDFSYAPYINAESAKTKGEAVMLVYSWMNSEEVEKIRYQEGVSLPWDFSVIQSTKLENPPKGWLDFAKLLEISKPIPITMKVDVSSAVSLERNFIDNVWSTNKKTTKQVVDEWTKAMNDGIKKYQEIHPEYDPSVAIDPSFDISR